MPAVKLNKHSILREAGLVENFNISCVAAEATTLFFAIKDGFCGHETGKILLPCLMHG